MERLRVPQKSLGLSVGSGIAALAIACGGGNGTEPKIQNGATLTPPAATEPAPTGTPTLEPPPTATEVKQEVPCQIIPQEYCERAKLIEFKYQGVDHKLIAFNLPEGTPLYSPKDGQLFTGEFNGEPFNGPFGSVQDPKNGFSFIGDVNITLLPQAVKKGDQIGTIQNTGITNFGEYNLIIFTTRANAQGTGPETDEEVLNTLFKL